MTNRFAVLAVASGLALAGCGTAPTVERGVVSSQARALLPYKQDINQIVRAADGCYYEVMEGSTAGYLSPLQNPYHEGRRICDTRAAQ